MNTADRRAEIIFCLSDVALRRKNWQTNFMLRFAQYKMIFRLYLLVFQSIRNREAMVEFLLERIISRI